MILDSKFVFFGNTNFSAIVLNSLVKGGYSPALVVCNPDRPTGRKKILTSSPVKKLVLDLKLPLYQPEILDDDAFQTLRSQTCDFFVLADYGKIFPKEVLQIPALGTIGVHVSFLPRYRGASPMQSAILNGEQETAVTLYLLDEKLDHGPILAVHKFPLDRLTFLELQRQSAILSGNLLMETIPKFLRGGIEPTTQDESQATYTRKFTTEDGFVDHDLLKIAQEKGGATAVEIDRKIRALTPEPGVWTIKNGKRMKLLEAEIRDGKLILKKMQNEGEKPKSQSF